jgi:ubiquinone/menaquinone biosynthesis C-methylase UbiE
VGRAFSVSDTIRYDEEPARRIQALGETPEMRAQRQRVIELLDPQPGWRVLDVGCGPGQLARELAAAVGPSGHVCGADVSEHMLALAGENEVELVHLSGTRLPFADEAFDAAVATQVYEFVERLTEALAELHRVLRPGGRALILDTDWDSLVWHSSDPERMDRVLAGWRRRVVDPRLPRTLARQLREAGFSISSCETLTILDVHGEPCSYSAHQIEHLGASAAGVNAAVIKAWAADLRDLASSGDYFFSLNRYLFLAVKALHERSNDHD